MAQITFQKSAIDPSECIHGGWDLVKGNLPTFVGMIIFQFIAAAAINMIPYAGHVLDPFIAGPLMCGFNFAVLKQLDGETANFSMIFEGFKRFLPSALISLLSTMPLLVLSLMTYYTDSSNPGTAGDTLPSAQTLFGTPSNAYISVLFLVVYVSLIVLSLLLIFALPLVADHNLNFLDAVKLSGKAAINNLGGLIGLLCLSVLVAIVGAFALCIGLLVALPVIFAANVVAYRQVFPNKGPEFNNEMLLPPPLPSAYGENYGVAE